MHYFFSLGCYGVFLWFFMDINLFGEKLECLALHAIKGPLGNSFVLSDFAG